MKECSLCDGPARTYCESDQASLCWDCDAKVHSANFLVARHSRTLLCQICQSHTPWKAFGSKLGPAVSVCDRCASRCDGRNERVEPQQQEERDREIDEEEEEEEEEDGEDDEDEDDDEEEDGENQVVPWSSTPPPATSSSSSEDSAETALPLKRTRENADLSSQDDLGCSSLVIASEEAISLGAFAPLNDRKKKATFGSVSRSAVIDSPERFKRQKVSNDEIVLDPTAVDLVSTASRSPLI